jgi:hypothetical protein
VVVNGDQIFIGNSKKVVEAAKEGMWLFGVEIGFSSW